MWKVEKAIEGARHLLGRLGPAEKDDFHKARFRRRLTKKKEGLSYHLQCLRQHQAKEKARRRARNRMAARSRRRNRLYG